MLMTDSRLVELCEKFYGITKDMGKVYGAIDLAELLVKLEKKYPKDFLDIREIGSILTHLIRENRISILDIRPDLFPDSGDIVHIRLRLV